MVYPTIQKPKNRRVSRVGVNRRLLRGTREILDVAPINLTATASNIATVANTPPSMPTATVSTVIDDSDEEMVDYADVAMFDFDTDIGHLSNEQILTQEQDDEEESSGSYCSEDSEAEVTESVAEDYSESKFDC